MKHLQQQVERTTGSCRESRRWPLHCAPPHALSAGTALLGRLNSASSYEPQAHPSFRLKTAVKRIQFHRHSCPFALLSAQLWESRFAFSLHSLIPRVHKSHSSCVLWQWDKHRRQRGLGAAVGVQLLLCQWGYNNISLWTNTRCKTKIPAACRCC